MTTDATSGRGRWREGRPAKLRPRHRPGREPRNGSVPSCLSSLLLAVIGVLGWLAFQFLFPYKPDPLFVPFWIARYQQEQIAPIPGMEAERAALKDGGAVLQDRLHPGHGHELDSRGHEHAAGQPPPREGQ